MTPSSDHLSQRIICVLGMHRSGTSLVARALNLLGMELGPPARMLPAKPDNPRGFWEYIPFVEINEAILSRLGGSWHEPPDLEQGWEHAVEMEDLRDRAQGLIREDFSTAPLWGWKDPRTCLTLPFWERVTSPSFYVLALRNPFDVAQSLERHHQLRYEKSVWLWLLHVANAIRLTSGKPRHFVFYEDFVKDWQSELGRLARAIGLSDTLNQTHVRTSVAAFLDAQLQHWNTPLISTMEDGRLPLVARSLYLLLRTLVDHYKLRDGPDPELEASVGALAESVLELKNADCDQLSEERNATGNLTAREKEDRRRIQNLSKQISNQERTVAELSAELTGKSADLTRRKGELAGKTTELGQKAEELAGIAVELAAVRDELSQIKGSLGWRLLQLYGPVKYRYLKPVVRKIRSIFRPLPFDVEPQLATEAPPEPALREFPVYEANERSEIEVTGLRIDLGCGSTKKPGTLGVDIKDGPEVDYVVDLETQPLPFEDRSVEYVHSSHFLEHVEDFGLLSSEISRVCRDGARLELWVPYGWHNSAFIVGHKKYLNEDVFLHRCVWYIDFWEPVLKARWLLEEFQYVVDPKTLVYLREKGISLAFGLQHLHDVVREFCTRIKVVHSDPKAPSPPIRRTFSVERFSPRYEVRYDPYTPSFASLLEPNSEQIDEAIRAFATGEALPPLDPL